MPPKPVALTPISAIQNEKLLLSPVFGLSAVLVAGLSGVSGIPVGGIAIAAFAQPYTVHFS